MHNLNPNFTFTIRNNYTFKKLFAGPEGRLVLKEFATRKNICNSKPFFAMSVICRLTHPPLPDVAAK